MTSTLLAHGATLIFSIIVALVLCALTPDELF